MTLIVLGNEFFKISKLIEPKVLAKNCLTLMVLKVLAKSNSKNQRLSKSLQKVILKFQMYVPESP